MPTNKELKKLKKLQLLDPEALRGGEQEEARKKAEEEQRLQHEEQMREIAEVKKSTEELRKSEPPFRGGEVVRKGSSKFSKFIENFSFTSFYDRFFENVKELYSYVFSLSLEYQLAFFNLFTSVLFLGLLSSTALNLYSQFLIDKFRLQERYPKLYRVLEFRKKVQRVYLYYNALVAIYFILMQISLNLIVLLY